jgi:hypothetical protein
MRQFVQKMSLLVVGLAASTAVFAGNGDRAGQAGATQLLINPWARSSGWAGANQASIRGLEAMNFNVAGTAFTKKTELIFSRTQWLKGSGININAFGFTQRLGKKEGAGVLGLSVMSIDAGDIMITTVELPEGGIGTYKPRFTNIHLSYAKAFSNSIYGGIAVKMISEAIPDANAMGVAFDAGVQYVTGKRDHIRFGIALRNVGPKMRYSGDGLSFRGTVPNGNTQTVSQRSEAFEIPSLLNIGGAYVAQLGHKDHNLTIAANFTANSFTKNQVQLGLEYAFKTYLMVRGGFNYENGIFKYDTRTTAFLGPTAGVTVEIPLAKEKGTTFGVDYSYRATDLFGGCHSFGARFNL